MISNKLLDEYKEQKCKEHVLPWAKTSGTQRRRRCLQRAHSYSQVHNKRGVILNGGGGGGRGGVASRILKNYYTDGQNKWGWEQNIKENRRN